MKFILLVEGDTEQRVLPPFLRRCFDEAGFSRPVGFATVNMGGWSNLYKDVEKKAHTYLTGPRRHPTIIAVVSLLDLYGPSVYPAERTTVMQRAEWMQQQLQARVAHEKFRHFSAVHEVEAWLLSQPNLFPSGVREVVAGLGCPPEQVNFRRPPKRLLNEAYERHLRRGYQQTIHGVQLFARLRPALARSRCPLFDRMLEELITMAKAAGA